MAARPKQTLLSENGETGDCWRCCVAALLDVPVETVPHFLRDGRSLCADTQRWLNARGYALVYTPGGDYPFGFSFPGWGGDQRAPIPVLACGPTVRTKKRGFHHAVVMLHGELVFDPHPSNAGLIWTTEQYLIVPFHAPAALRDPATGRDCDTKRGACACGGFHVNAEAEAAR